MLGAAAPATSDFISAGLRRLLDDVAHEPVPDSFLRLLDQIDAARASSDPRAEQPPPADGEAPGQAKQ